MIRFAILSDQHGTLPDIPPADAVILSGDLTNGNQFGPLDGTDATWQEWLNGPFRRWIANGPPAVVIAGNHDTCIQRFGFPVMPQVAYLQDSHCFLCGFKVWGFPWVPKFDNLAFNWHDRFGHDALSAMPNDTDILVCHAPPFGVADVVNGNHVGFPSISNAINMVRPKLVTCGHIHEGRGVYDVFGTKVVNAAGGFITVDM